MNPTQEAVQETPSPTNPRETSGKVITLERLTYTAAEVAALLGVSKITIWRLEKRGLLPPVPGLRTKLYSKRVVERFVSGEVQASA